jgi:diguanylate cyclase (GGDEF)-like protein
MDIDHFKQVNDEYGHLYGDEVLLLFSRLMTKSFRHYDLLFRYGGEEFVVVLNNTDLETALTILERFRITIENYNFPQIGRKTISIGVTEISDQTMLSNVIDRADKALYYAKKNGRNQVCCYEKLVGAGLISNKTATEDIELF